MPIFERPPLETLTPARERWTPIYLEHGRLHVDDSSVKWISAENTVFRIPAATVSAIMLGPGTTITHAAIKACSDSNTPVCWIGEDGLRFYSFGVSPTFDNRNSRKHASAYSSRSKRTEIARRMFSRRFPEQDVSTMRVDQLRGMEGRRVRELYQRMGAEYGVTWKGRRYDADNWDLADGINRGISAANASLYALCTAVVCSLGFLPQLGFVHQGGTLPFVFDVADLYKHETTLPAAFQAASVNPEATGQEVLALFKIKVEETRLLRRLPDELESLFT